MGRSGHRSWRRWPVVGALLLSSLVAHAGTPRPHVCLVSLTLPEDLPVAQARALRKTLEQALQRDRAIAHVSAAAFEKAARKLEIAEADRTKAESVSEIAYELELDVAVLVFLTRHDKKLRLLLAAVDPFDGHQLATTSRWLARPRVSAKDASAMVRTLLKDTLKTLRQEQTEPPPPPPPAPQSSPLPEP